MAIEVPPALAKLWGLERKPDQGAVVRVRALRSFCLGAGVDLKVGEVVEIPLWRARDHLALGKLEIVPAAPGPVVLDTSEVLLDTQPTPAFGSDPALASGDPALEAGDPALGARKRKKG